MFIATEMRGLRTPSEVPCACHCVPTGHPDGVSVPSCFVPTNMASMNHRLVSRPMWTHYHLHVDGWRLHTWGVTTYRLKGKSEESMMAWACSIISRPLALSPEAAYALASQRRAPTLPWSSGQNSTNSSVCLKYAIDLS